uniref:Uncharacterized protein n=1 Tax=Caenorhabditis japonica TaxID=281687 RepID=A0A8R1EJU6_CAEJA
MVGSSHVHQVNNVDIKPEAYGNRVLENSGKPNVASKKEHAAKIAQFRTRMPDNVKDLDDPFDQLSEAQFNIKTDYYYPDCIPFNVRKNLTLRKFLSGIFQYCLART